MDEYTKRFKESQIVIFSCRLIYFVPPYWYIETDDDTNGRKARGETLICI